MDYLIRYYFVILFVIDIIFSKTLQGETFTTDLIPSLSSNVSYIRATDTAGNQLYYKISSESEIFSVDEKTGNVYLIKWLKPNQENLQRFEHVEITVTDGRNKLSIRNRIIILNANVHQPEFINPQVTFFEIFENNNPPNDLTYKNGTIVEFVFENRYSIESEIQVGCENTVEFPDVCSIFEFRKNEAKSTKNRWLGSLKILKRLNYMEHSLLQLNAIAKNNPSNVIKVVFAIKILPNIDTIPKISESSYFFTIPEETPEKTFIGELKIDENYDSNLKDIFLFDLVYTPEELLYNKISYRDMIDVDFGQVRKSFKIIDGNKLYTNSTIDRDSISISEASGLIKIWIKIYSKENPLLFSYFPINVLIEDINDNGPSFLISKQLLSQKKFSRRQENYTLEATIDENETGPLLFHYNEILSSLRNLENANNSAKSYANVADQNRHFIVYDPDLGINSSFEIAVSPMAEHLESEKIANKHFRFTHSFFNEQTNIGNHQKYALSSLSEKTTSSLSSILAINSEPFDFDTLNIEPFMDPITGVAIKSLRFNLIVKESLSASRERSAKSNSVPMLIKIRDTNDNKPKFSQIKYEANVPVVFNRQIAQDVLKFDVKDNDLGIYGVLGFKCFLFGDDSDKFEIDLGHQKILLKACPKCTQNDLKPLYKLDLICKDDIGRGNMGSASVRISFDKQTKVGFTLQKRDYYILASGNSGTEIISLRIRPQNLDASNRISYSIRDGEMAKYFVVDDQGVFKIVANQLTREQSPFMNGTFIVDVDLVDSFGHKDTVKVTVQVAEIFKNLQCPRIVESAMCRFSINRTTFDPINNHFYNNKKDIIRFCFYGAYPISMNFNQKFKKIYYSLMPEAPSYLYINPDDGCVKIMPWFNLAYLNPPVIQYKVGVFNPENTDCISITQRQCTITIENALKKELKCVNKLTIIDSGTSAKLDVYSPDPDSILNYIIIREEKTTFDGDYEINLNYHRNFFKINPNDGFIELITSNFNVNSMSKYSSILIVVKVQDLNLLSTSTECLVDFRFLLPKPVQKPSKFIGRTLRTECICEDIPERTFITSLKGFSPFMLSNEKKLCYSILDNENFQLNGNVQPAPEGDLYLTRRLESHLINSQQINLTARLFYCNEPNMLAEQLVNFQVYRVNKFAPKVLTMTHTVQMSLRNVNNISSAVLPIEDGDFPPFDRFNCWVDNRNDFSVMNRYDQKQIIITYQNPLNLPNLLRNTDHADLAIKCCDDMSYWTINQCQSVSKCSITLIRAQFIDYIYPMYCLNNQQVIYVIENTPVLSRIGNALCGSDCSRYTIKYQLLSRTDYFSINPNDGSITLIKSLFFSGIKSQILQIQCTNGFTASICQLNIVVIPMCDFNIVWVIPNPTICHQCISIRENTPINSLITAVEAIVPNLNITIYYSFAFNGMLVESLYEFQFNSPLSGQIYLAKSLNRTIGEIRELTLAASAKRPSDQQIVTSFQYLCIKILPSYNYEPCFRRTPDNLIWPYQVLIVENMTSTCYDQVINVFNVDSSMVPVFYYLLPRSTSDKIFDKFFLDPITGTLCKTNLISNNQLIREIVNSTFRYLDELGHICVNLYVFASRREIRYQTELNSIIFDAKNCSFNIIKICIDKHDFNFNPPCLNKTVHCEAAIKLDNVFPTKAKCLYNFQYINVVENPQFYNFQIIPKRPQLYNDIFSIEKSCLLFDIKTISHNNSIVGLNTFDVYVYDRFARSDSITCNIYITQYCTQRYLVLITASYVYVQKNLFSYTCFLDELAIKVFSKNIYIVVHSVMDVSANYIKGINLKDINSIIEISLYDQDDMVFLNNSQVATALNSQLDSNRSRALGINRIVQACPVISIVPDVSKWVAVGLIIFFLLLLLGLLPLLLLGLCCNFKLLKYKDNSIICRDRVIPIIEPMRPTIAKIEPTIICEQSLDDDERIISPLPLPPPRKNSIRSKTSPDLDDIQIEESIPRHNAAFKRYEAYEDQFAKSTFMHDNGHIIERKLINFGDQASGSRNKNHKVSNDFVSEDYQVMYDTFGKPIGGLQQKPISNDSAADSSDKRSGLRVTGSLRFSDNVDEFLHLNEPVGETGVVTVLNQKIIEDDDDYMKRQRENLI